MTRLAEFFLLKVDFGSIWVLVKFQVPISLTISEINNCKVGKNGIFKRPQAAFDTKFSKSGDFFPKLTNHPPSLIIKRRIWGKCRENYLTTLSPLKLTISAEKRQKIMFFCPKSSISREKELSNNFLDIFPVFYARFWHTDGVL